MYTASPKLVIFISYSHRDEPEHPGPDDVQWLSFVRRYLEPAVKYGVFDLWVDRHMPGGADWNSEIEQKLRECDVFILLVSANSMASDYIVDKEIAIIRKRQASGDPVHFYPLLLTPTPKAGLQKVQDKNLRPRDAKPLSGYGAHDRAQQMTDIADEIAELVKKIAEPKERVSAGRLLSYNRTTQADPGCIPLLLSSLEPAQIAYFENIAEAVRKLAERDRRPEDFLLQNPYFSTLTDIQEGERRASSALAYNGELLRQTRDAARRSEQALNVLLKRLGALGAPDDLAAKSLGTFATLAALRMIRILKTGYDFVNGNPQLWFEAYKFNSDGSYCWFDWVPHRSDTGRLVFGYRLWVGARVGHERKYEYVMFPLKFVLPLFRDGVEGDNEGFYTWVLPQLVINGSFCQYPVEDFPNDDWEAFLLQGANSEWWSNVHECPWPEVVKTINMIEF